MEQKTININLIGNQKLLIEEPEFVEKMYFEPSNESIYARHTFTSKPVFIGLMPQEYVYLFTQRLITIKSWRINIKTNELQLKIILT